MVSALPFALSLPAIGNCRVKHVHLRVEGQKTAVTEVTATNRHLSYVVYAIPRPQSSNTGSPVVPSIQYISTWTLSGTRPAFLLAFTHQQKRAVQGVCFSCVVDASGRRPTFLRPTILQVAPMSGTKS